MILEVEMIFHDSKFNIWKKKQTKREKKTHWKKNNESFHNLTFSHFNHFHFSKRSISVTFEEWKPRRKTNIELRILYAIFGFHWEFTVCEKWKKQIQLNFVHLKKKKALRTFIAFSFSITFHYCTCSIRWFVFRLDFLILCVHFFFRFHWISHWIHQWNDGMEPVNRHVFHFDDFFFVFVFRSFWIFPKLSQSASCPDNGTVNPKWKSSFITSISGTYFTFSPTGIRYIFSIFVFSSFLSLFFSSPQIFTLLCRKTRCKITILIEYVFHVRFTFFYLNDQQEWYWFTWSVNVKWD